MTLLPPDRVKGVRNNLVQLDYFCNCKSEISNVCRAVEGHCLQAMKVVHHHVNGCFGWLTSGHQSVNRSREAIYILSGKYKRFTFLLPVSQFSVFACTFFLKRFTVEILGMSGCILKFFLFRWCGASFYRPQLHTTTLALEITNLL